MNRCELQAILGYLNIGLAIAHNRGVSIGHFGNTDFIQMAEAVNSVFLHAIAPEESTVPVSVPAPVVAAAPTVVSRPAAASGVSAS